MTAESTNTKGSPTDIRMAGTSTQVGPTDTQDGALTDVRVDARVDARTDAQANTRTNVRTSVQADTQTGVRTCTQTDARTAASISAQIVTRADALDVFQHDLGRRLRLLRLAAGLTQEDVGKHIDMSRVGVGYIEQGRRAPSLATLGDLATLYNMTISELTDVSGCGAVTPNQSASRVRRPL